MTTAPSALADAIEQLKACHGPLTLTIDGKPAAILQESAAYERMINLLEAADTRDAIREDVEDVAAGRTRPASVFFEEMRRKYAVPRKPLHSCSRFRPEFLRAPFIAPLSLAMSGSSQPTHTTRKTRCSKNSATPGLYHNT